MSQFTIANGTVGPQKEIFESVNHAISTLGVTADEFDIEFRCQLMRACQNVAWSAQFQLAKEMHANPDTRPHITGNQTVQQLLATGKSIDQSLIPEARIQVGER